MTGELQFVQTLLLVQLNLLRVQVFGLLDTVVLPMLVTELFSQTGHMVQEQHISLVMLVGILLTATRGPEAQPVAKKTDTAHGGLILQLPQQLLAIHSRSEVTLATQETHTGMDTLLGSHALEVLRSENAHAGVMETYVEHARVAMVPSAQKLILILEHALLLARLGPALLSLHAQAFPAGT